MPGTVRSNRASRLGAVRTHALAAGSRMTGDEERAARRPGRPDGRPDRCPRVGAGYPNVNTLETLSPHLATFLSQPWLCERAIKWFMHSLDVFGEIRSNLSEQIAVELLFPV